jgi:hypothetical protein
MLIMFLKKRYQTHWISFGFHVRLFLSFTFLLLLVSCNSASGPNLKKDRELRLQVKPVMLIENELLTRKDVVDMIDKSTIRRGGYVAIISTSLIPKDKKAINLQNLFYGRQIEAVHILNFESHTAVQNADVLTIENATILCLLDGDSEKFVQMADYPVLKSAILKAYKKGTLVVMNGHACSLANDNYLNFTK